MLKNLLKSCIAPAALSVATVPAHAAWNQLNMTQGVTEISRSIYDLHMLIFWVCVAIGVVVFGWIIWSLISFRKSKGAVADTTLLHSTRVETIWTVIPVLILVAMAVPAARALIQIEDTSNTGLTIKVTGFQWGWQYEYIDSGVSFFSRIDRVSDAARQLGSGVDPHSVPDYLLNVDNPLVVPAGVKVRLLLSAADVIHAWWVPAFGMKRDAIPGFISEMWFQVDADKTGLYRGQCAELCGRDHGFMPIVVDVRNPDDFKSWLAERTNRPASAPAPAAQSEPAVAKVAAVASTVER